MNELLGLVGPAEVRHFCRTTFSGDTVWSRLHAQGVHDVAEVLVDGCVAKFSRGARVGSCYAARIAAGAFTVSAVEGGRTVVQVDCLARLEVTAAASRLDDGQVVEVVCIAVRQLLEPDGRRIVENAALSFGDAVEHLDQIGELARVERINQEDLLIDARYALATHARIADTVRDVVVLVRAA